MIKDKKEYEQAQRILLALKEEPEVLTPYYKLVGMSAQCLLKTFPASLIVTLDEEVFLEITTPKGIMTCVLENSICDNVFFSPD